MKQIAEKVFLCLMALAVLGTLGLLALGVRSDVSFYENRTLADAPTATRETILSGEYFAEWETWFLDHLKGRTLLLKANIALDLFGYRRPVVQDMVVSSDVLLPESSYNVWDTGYLAQQGVEIAARWKDLSDYVESQGGTFYYLGLPYQAVYFYEHYPDYLADGHWYAEECRSVLFSSMEEAGVTAIDMTSEYAEMGYPDAFYSAVDHHYTFAGAFAAYQVLMAQINETSGLKLRVLAEDDLNITTLPNPYLGSSLRKLYGLWPSDERVQIAELKEPIPFTRTDNGQAVAATLNAPPANDSDAVTYSVYMGGDVAETIIDTGREDLPKLLLFGDSYSNPLETLLYASFGESRYLDLRHYTEKSLLEYIEEYQPDVVIAVRDSTTYYATTGNGDFNGAAD